ncbi:hypothetical protein [Bacillus sp. 1P06AnD]|uniref:hypothetical protein n=1 Tax=Bacillus sp. 1P06AnD TaxID=3132208 RepID=UPI00399F3FF2
MNRVEKRSCTLISTRDSSRNRYYFFKGERIIKDLIINGYAIPVFIMIISIVYTSYVFAFRTADNIEDLILEESPRTKRRVNRYRKKWFHPIKLVFRGFLLLFCIGLFIVSIAMLWEAIKVTPSIIHGDSEFTSGPCSIEYYEESRGGSDLYIHLKNKEEQSFVVPAKDWSYGSLKKAYCEVEYYGDSDFDTHYRIFDKKDGKLLQKY